MVRPLAVPELVLIDLDGTLVDSAPDLSHCIALMLDQLGYPAPEPDAVRHWIGNGVERLIHRALTGTMDGQADVRTYQQAHDLFHSLYERHNGHFSRVYPGVVEGLDYLAGLACPLVCVTNKPARFTAPLLSRFGLSDYFGLILAGDSLPRKKPDPMPLLHAAEYFGAKSEKSWLIGDSVTDIQAARAARFSAICVSYGYNHGRDIRDVQPDWVLDSLTELRHWIDPQ